MRSKFDEQLEKLKQKLIETGKDAENIIIDATKGLLERNIDSAKEAIEAYPEIESNAREIENICINLLLQQQPVATDLRTISSILKIITDIRRIRSDRYRYCRTNNISYRAK